MENSLEKSLFKNLLIEQMGETMDKETLAEWCKEEIVKEIRLDTLRQVLPVIKTHKEGEGDYCDTGEDMDGACRSNCVELAVERLINKAKELWGIELNNN